MAFFKKAAVAYVHENQLSLSMRKELEKGISTPGRPDVQSVVELDGTDIGAGWIRFAGRDVPGDSLYRNVVTLFGNFNQAVNERSNNLATVELEVDIADELRTFDMLAATYRNKLRGIPARIVMVSPNASSYTRFEGVLDSFRKSSDGDWLLRLRPDDKSITNGEVPKVKINTTDFPDLDETVDGEYVPIWMGDWDSFGISDEGAVRAYRVDTVGFRDLVGLGKYTVNRVYKAGVAQTSGFAITYPIINGKQFTLIDWTSNPSSTEITADIAGIGSVSGDGFYYSNYRNPAYQLVWVMANLIFNDWRSGAYADLRTVPIDMNSFRKVATYFDRLGYYSSHYFKDPAKGETIINEWAESTGVKLFWTNRGRVAAKPIMITPDTRSYLMPWLKGDTDGSSLSLPYDAAQITRSYELEYTYQEAEGEYQNNLVVSDTEVEDKVVITKQLPWSEAAQ